MENFKMRQLEFSFKVDESNKVVVCNAKFGVPFDQINTVGVAIAKNEDFNLEKGKKLARARAEKNAYVKYNEILTNRIKIISKYKDNLEYTLNKNAEHLQNQKDYIKTF